MKVAVTTSYDDIAGETDRLLLRGFRLDDAEDVLEMYRDPEVMRFLAPMQPVTSLDEQRAAVHRIREKYVALEGRYGAYAVVHKPDGRVVGTALLKLAPDTEGKDTADVEIGWHLTRRVWGQGFATEMGHLLMKRAEEVMKLDRVIAIVDPPNARSAKVAARIGMTHEGATTAYYQGGPYDLWVRRFANGIGTRTQG